GNRRLTSATARGARRFDRVCFGGGGFHPPDARNVDNRAVGARGAERAKDDFLVSRLLASCLFTRRLSLASTAPACYSEMVNTETQMIFLRHSILISDMQIAAVPSPMSRMRLEVSITPG
ncbi:MAG: hypothetical protein JW910_17960, partial [Anaerolineae bacterium]|nr:hypothetical protein [Anaerolineae bacterium]